VPVDARRTRRYQVMPASVHAIPLMPKLLPRQSAGQVLSGFEMPVPKTWERAAQTALRLGAGLSGRDISRGVCADCAGVRCGLEGIPA
jgi:hypothetical protein